MEDWAYLKVLTYPPKAASEIYGPWNKTYFSVRVSHGGVFNDFPGSAYVPAKVCYFESLSVKTYNMEVLERFSKRLGYKTMGQWYYINSVDRGELEMIQLHDNHDCEKFSRMVVRNGCRLLEQLFVEHAKPETKIVYPNELIKPGARRIPKLVCIHLAENPDATIEDCHAYVRKFMGFNVPDCDMVDVMNMAKHLMDEARMK